MRSPPGGLGDPGPTRQLPPGQRSFSARVKRGKGWYGMEARLGEEFQFKEWSKGVEPFLGSHKFSCF